jgi:hypothetical protein
MSLLGVVARFGRRGKTLNAVGKKERALVSVPDWGRKAPIRFGIGVTGKRVENLPASGHGARKCNDRCDPNG